MKACKYVPYHKDPVVNCDGNQDCEKCGWNPKVHDQRIAEGYARQKLSAEEAAQIMTEFEEKWAAEETRKRAEKGRVRK